MSQEIFIIECENPECLFRFPSKAIQTYGLKCPKCKSNAAIKNKYTENSSPKSQKIIGGPKVSLLLDNIRSVYNVGSILRTADGFGMKHIYFCGITATPNDPKIAKTSLGAEWSIPWSYHNNNVRLMKNLKEKECFILGLEVGVNSIPILKFHINKDVKNIILIVGNELAGIDPEIREQCNQLIYIPMFGHKQSYNVTIAFGIAAFYLTSVFNFGGNIKNSRSFV